MYANWIQKYRDICNDIEDQLIDMALDPRLMPGVAAQLRSSASTPSLRSREGSVTPLGTRMDPGGNVRVVVRVRGFLPRGELPYSMVYFGANCEHRGRERSRMFD